MKKAYLFILQVRKDRIVFFFLYMSLSVNKIKYMFHTLQTVPTVRGYMNQIWMFKREKNAKPK